METLFHIWGGGGGVGGGGGELGPNFGRYVPRQSEKWGAFGMSSSVKMRVSGASSSVKVGSSELTVGRIWLAIWLAAYPGALPERFA